MASLALFNALLLGHALLALIWVGAVLAALPLTLKLYGASGEASTFKRAAMLRNVIAGAGGLSILLGIALIYYVESVDTSFAPSATGAPLVALGAILGAVAFGLSTYQSRSLRTAFKARSAQSQKNAASPTGSSQAITSTQKLPPKGLVISTPIILIVALLLMVAGSMM